MTQVSEVKMGVKMEVMRFAQDDCFPFGIPLHSSSFTSYQRSWHNFHFNPSTLTLIRF